VTTSATAWLGLTEVATLLDVSPGKVRRLIQENSLLARRIDGVWSVPEVFFDDDGVVGDLKGTAVVLIDGGFSSDQALDWLLADNDLLGLSPIEAIRQGRKTEVRRLAQTLAY
jgi:hypothetical protein